MLSDERMSIDERRKYLKLVAPRYALAKRRKRSELLTRDGSGHGVTSEEPYKADGDAKSGACTEKAQA